MTTHLTPDVEIVTVAEHAQVTVEITSPLFHLCPHRDEEDAGDVLIRWRCRGKTIELHSLNEYLGWFDETLVSHEELTYQLLHDIGSLPGIADVEVITTWNTAGMGVRCSTTPTLAETRR